MTVLHHTEVIEKEFDIGIKLVYLSEHPHGGVSISSSNFVEVAVHILVVNVPVLNPVQINDAILVLRLTNVLYCSIWRGECMATDIKHLTIF